MRVLAIGPDMGAFTLRIGFLGYLILYLPRDHKRKLFLAIPTTTVWALRDLGLEFRGFGVLGCVSEFAWDLSSFRTQLVVIGFRTSCKHGFSS